MDFKNKTFILSIFEWPLKTGFTVNTYSDISSEARGLDFGPSHLIHTFLYVGNDGSGKSENMLRPAWAFAFCWCDPGDAISIEISCTGPSLVLRV